MIQSSNEELYLRPSSRSFDVEREGEFVGVDWNCELESKVCHKKVSDICEWVTVKGDDGRGRGD